ncbi:MAG: ankyrin repeat domain-containing protein [Candidatus Bilamarchaeaceae archaeon]
MKYKDFKNKPKTQEGRIKKKKEFQSFKKSETEIVSKEEKKQLNSKLIEAANTGNAELVKRLIERGADVNAKTGWGKTALMRAAMGGHTETAKLLIERGADVNAKSNNGETALMYALVKGHPEIAELLRKAGAKE